MGTFRPIRRTTERSSGPERVTGLIAIRSGHQPSVDVVPVGELRGAVVDGRQAREDLVLPQRLGVCVVLVEARDQLLGERARTSSSSASPRTVAAFVMGWIRAGAWTTPSGSACAVQVDALAPATCLIGGRGVS